MIERTFRNTKHVIFDDPVGVCVNALFSAVKAVEMVGIDCNGILDKQLLLRPNTKLWFRLSCKRIFAAPTSDVNIVSDGITWYSLQPIIGDRYQTRDKEPYYSGLPRTLTSLDQSLIKGAIRRYMRQLSEYNKY